MAKQDVRSLDATVDHAEAEFRRACEAYVAGVDVEDGALWQKLIDRSIRAGLPAKEIAEVARCSISSVSRWAEGLTVPPVAARYWIRERLVDRFATLRSDPVEHSVRRRASAQSSVPVAAE